MKSKSMLHLAREYVEYRRKLGFQIKVEGAQTIRFAEFADSIGHQGPLTKELVLEWARLPKNSSPLYHARRLEVVRAFAKYLAALDPKTWIPENGLLGRAHRRTQPHIYSPAEIDRLMSAARRLIPMYGLRPRTFATLIGLMASTGLRTKEALDLVCEDVDFGMGILTIRETKFYKSRIVPLDKSTTRALRNYAKFRDAYVSIPKSKAFLLGENGDHLSRTTVYRTFRLLCAASGLRSTNQRRKTPRLYDLRHTFCTRRLLDWHRRAADVEQL
ncbi:MAG: tyrosine-type recombinase/integrase, partial [Planctomycetota bacterium]